MTTTPAWPIFLPRWLRYVGVWVLLMVVCGPQTLWSGAAKSWVEVFWIQVTYWFSWAVITPAIFWLCRRLYDGPRIWSRYVPGLMLGLIGVSLLHPLLENSFRFAKDWLEYLAFGRDESTTRFCFEDWLVRAEGKRHKSVHVWGHRLCLACNAVCERPPQPADQIPGTRIAPPRCATSSLAQPIEPTFSVQYTSLNCRTGA